VCAASSFDDPAGSLGGFPFVVWGKEQSHVLVASSEADRSAWITSAVTGADAAKLKSLSRLSILSSSSGVFNGSARTSIDDSTLCRPAPTNARGAADARSHEPETEVRAAPVFTADNATNACEHCGIEFMLLVRPRHHCRSCGHLVCHDCSPYKMLVRDSAAAPQRVCIRCFLSRSQDSEKRNKPDLLASLPIARSLSSVSSISSDSVTGSNLPVAVSPHNSDGKPVHAAESLAPVTAVSLVTRTPVVPDQSGLAEMTSSAESIEDPVR
jgi:hypothetical protein